MKKTITLLAVYFAALVVSPAQVVPEATGPGGGATAGSNLNYALRYAQTARFWAQNPTEQNSSLSGSVAYANGNERYPFNLEYAGGYQWNISGPSQVTGLFQHLYLSQNIVGRRWQIQLSDDTGYYPQSPITGFSGIPGIGEPIGVTNPAPPSGQTILGVDTNVVENHAQGHFLQNLSNSLIVDVGGSSDLLRYPNGDGLDTDTVNGSGQLAKRLDGRNSIYGKFQYSEYSYPGYTITFTTDTGLFGYDHKWTRNLTSQIAAGPEWISSSDTLAVPTSVNFSALASVHYALRFDSASLTYMHGTNGGAGYLLGAESDAIQGGYSRGVGPNLTFGLTGGYDRTAGLNGNGVTNSIFGGAQTSWRVRGDLIVFANYTGTDQFSSSALSSTALSQVMQVIGFGIGFSPRETQLRK